MTENATSTTATDAAKLAADMAITRKLQRRMRELRKSLAAMDRKLSELSRTAHRISRRHRLG